MKIGFQGDFFSNSHNAALKFAGQENIDFEGVPLINSYPVLQALANGEIDYGVVAYKNSIAGMVKETEAAREIFGSFIREIEEITLPIHHCLFRLPGENGDAVRYIYSHEQALRQCDAFLRAHYPDAVIQPEKDTSLAAWNLVTGKYGAGSAVICNKECGEHYELTLLEENMESDKNNRTTFKVFARMKSEELR